MSLAFFAVSFDYGGTSKRSEPFASAICLLPVHWCLKENQSRTQRGQRQRCIQHKVPHIVSYIDMWVRRQSNCPVLCGDHLVAVAVRATAVRAPTALEGGHDLHNLRYKIGIVLARIHDASSIVYSLLREGGWQPCFFRRSFCQ